MHGLVELVDNNPLVCTEEFSVPSPLATLALIALGPLCRAGLIDGSPALHSSCALVADDLMAHLEQEGLSQEVTLTLGAEDFGAAAVLNAFVPIPEMDDYELLDGLYDEVFGRSFYVRSRASEDWDTSLVVGRPHAAYDLRITPGDGQALLTVRVMADKRGKLGACQMLHAFNVMNGFEEHLGIPDSF
jgi:hypothetical protein